MEFTAPKKESTRADKIQKAMTMVVPKANYFDRWPTGFLAILRDQEPITPRSAPDWRPNTSCRKNVMTVLMIGNQLNSVAAYGLGTLAALPPELWILTLKFCRPGELTMYNEDWFNPNPRKSLQPPIKVGQTFRDFIGLIPADTPDKGPSKLKWFCVPRFGDYCSFRASELKSAAAIAKLLDIFGDPTKIKDGGDVFNWDHLLAENWPGSLTVAPKGMEEAVLSQFLEPGTTDWGRGRHTLVYKKSDPTQPLNTTASVIVTDDADVSSFLSRIGEPSPVSNIQVRGWAVIIPGVYGMQSR